MRKPSCGRYRQCRSGYAQAPSTIAVRMPSHYNATCELSYVWPPPFFLTRKGKSGVATATAFEIAGFPFADEPTVNSKNELTVATSGSHNLRRRSVPTQRSALRLPLTVKDAGRTAQEHPQSAGQSTCLRCNQVRVRSRRPGDQEEQISILVPDFRCRVGRRGERSPH